MSHQHHHGPAESVAPPRGPLGFFRDFHNRTILFRVGDVIVTTYSVLAGLAFAVGLATALWVNAMSGLDVPEVSRFYLFWLLPAVLLGLRSFSMMLEWRSLFERPLQTIVKPGYMLHGGIFGAVVAILLWTRVSGYNALTLFDGAALGVTLGESIARLGCYCYGCCWGRPTNSVFGVAYTSKDSKVVRCAPHLHGVKIHPAQLYALVLHLAFFIVLVELLPYKLFDGMIGATYLLVHAGFRFTLETFRQDNRGKLFGRFSHTNFYTLAQVAFAAGLLAVGYASDLHTPMNLDIGFWSVALDPQILPWILVFGVIFGTVYGVHYKRVGSWISEDGAP